MPTGWLAKRFELKKAAIDTIAERSTASREVQDQLQITVLVFSYLGSVSSRLNTSCALFY